MQLGRVTVAAAGRAATAGRAFDQVAWQAGPELGDLGGDLAGDGVWLGLRLKPCPLLARRQGPPPVALKRLVSRSVLVQRVLMPGSGAESWTLLGDDGEVVEPAERYLAYLAAIERSPNTVRAYAVSLKLWFEFLACARVGGQRWASRTWPVSWPGCGRRRPTWSCWPRGRAHAGRPR